MNQKGFADPEQPHVATGYTQGMEIVNGVPRGQPLPCCGLGVGWTLFILGFFIGIPWYIGAFMLICVIRKKDYRERPGCFACVIGAVFLTIGIIVQVVLTLHRTNDYVNPQY